jgi:hypothetical protein
MTTTATTRNRRGFSALLDAVIVDFGRVAWALGGVPDPALLAVHVPHDRDLVRPGHDSALVTATVVSPR